MKYRLVSLFSILFGVFLLIVVAAARFAFFISTISFETNGAAPIQSVEIEAGDTLDLPSPTREGYTFGGWFLDSEYQRSANVLVLNNQDRTLYAYWLPNLYTVTFDSNGGSDVDAVTQTFDSEFLVPTQPTLEGYDFAGWFTDDETFLQSFTFGTHPLDTNLFAKWTATVYDITYNVNGGVLAVGEKTSYTVEDDLVVFNDPTRVGYTFDGWYDNSAFDGDVYVAINPNRMEELDLFAKWIVNQYTITFDELGGSQVDNITQDFGTSLTAPTAPTKTGYTFLGWSLEGQPFTFSTMPVDGADLAAIWQVNSHTISLNVNGGTGISDTTLDFDYDASITLTDPTRLGYTFNGWSDGSKTWTSGDDMPDNDLSLAAQWSLANYSITYVMNFGFNNDDNPTTYTVLEAVTLLAPTKTGNTFDGWYSDPAFTQPITQIPVGSTGNKNIHAKWIVNRYTISLNVNGGTPLSSTTLTVDYGSLLALPDPVRDGYDFDGWETAEEVRYSNGSFMPPLNLALIAQWEIKTYDVIYYLFKADIADSNKLPAATVEYLLNEFVTERTYSNPGYDFVGWFDASDDEAFEFDFPMTDISEPYIIYGEWIPIVYKVIYNLQDDEAAEATLPSENPVEFTVEDPILPLSDPTRPGYTFNGWRNDGNVITSSIGGGTTLDNITLTATWQLVRYDITYDAQGGINPFGNPSDFNVEETRELFDATKVGYTFNGWQNQDGNIMTEIPAGTSRDLTLTAQWTINKHNFSYNPANGQPTIFENNKDYETTLGMVEPTRRGYTFMGWEDANGTSFYAEDTMPDRALALTGEWRINDYYISYDLNNGISNASNPTEFTVLDSIQITNPTRTGWVFVGWDNADDGTANHFQIAGKVTIGANVYAEDLNLKAVWTQNIYTLSYNTDGGNSISNKTFTFSQTLDGTYFPTPTKAGETFTGWYDSTGARWGVGGNSNNTGPNNNLALTARWATFPYSVTYDADNGENTYSTSIYPGSPVYIGFTPYKEGYTFAGWKDLDDGTFYTAESIMPTKSLTLTAQWIANN
jgi:uncharacterized repeat protein (TIGR02543 family)